MALWSARICGKRLGLAKPQCFGLRRIQRPQDWCVQRFSIRGRNSRQHMRVEPKNGNAGSHIHFCFTKYHVSPCITCACRFFVMEPAKCGQTSKCTVSSRARSVRPRFFRLIVYKSQHVAYSRLACLSQSELSRSQSPLSTCKFGPDTTDRGPDETYPGCQRSEPKFQRGGRDIKVRFGLVLLGAPKWLRLSESFLPRCSIQSLLWFRYVFAPAWHCVLKRRLRQ